MLPVIQAEELLQLTDFVLIDARAGNTAREQYRENHLRGARFADLETDLAHKEADAANGGRHPLPNPETFAAFLEQQGISPNTHIVVYDDKNGANAAARFWWMMRAAGHEQIQVLNGGMQAAVNAGFPLSSGEEAPAVPGKYTCTKWQLPLAGIHEVEIAAQHENMQVIDVRDAYRYNGESEPIDLVAGHIPGAVNIPFSENLDAGGFFLSPNTLKEKYVNALGNRPAQNVIVHCGSGVTACHTLLAMAYAGLEIPKLYVGSWSEWSRTGRPVGKNN